MAQRRTSQTRFNSEVAQIVTVARTLGCSAFEAAGHLPARPTNKAIEKAHDRLLEADGLPAPADPFAGLPRW
jgi:hypothetical protein